jgi:preprotein translocase subunit SecD
VIALDDADADQQADLKAFSCPTTAETAADQSTSDIACDSSGQKYLLRPAAWEGRAVSATATLPDYGGGWVVDVQLGTTGARAFSRLTRKLYASGAQLAFLVGGRVITAAVVNGVITTGQLEVAGLDKTSATALAHQLA